MLSLESPTRRQLAWLTAFAVAMAQLEATVVVYLRQLYYPEGFDFPLVIIGGRIAAIEVVREVATIVMLVAVAKVYAARDSWRQYAAFLWAFGVWDIFYYVGLRAMLGWPASLLDFDVLFLIPLPWIAPVLAPVLISLVMMGASWAILSLRDHDRVVQVTRAEWAVTVGGAIALIALFVSDARSVIDGDMPRPFRWLPYSLMLLAPMAAAGRAFRRSHGSSLRVPSGTGPTPPG